MTISRIRKIEGYGDPKWFGGIFDVWFEGSNEPLRCCKAQLDMLKFENEMLQQGVSEQMIEKYRDLVTYYIHDEEARDRQCE